MDIFTTHIYLRNCIHSFQVLFKFSVDTTAQGGRKVILDGGSLVIRKMVFFQRISHLKFFHYIKSKKMGAPRDTRGPQFRPPWATRIFMNVVI